MTSPLCNENTRTARALWNRNTQLAHAPQLQLKGYIGHLYIPLLARTPIFERMF